MAQASNFRGLLHDNGVLLHVRRFTEHDDPSIGVDCSRN